MQIEDVLTTARRVGAAAAIAGFAVFAVAACENTGTGDETTESPGVESPAEDMEGTEGTG